MLLQGRGNMILFGQARPSTCSTILIGASPTLAGLHCGSVFVTYVLALWSYTVNFKCAFKYFPKIEHPRALTMLYSLLPECSVGNCSGNGSSFKHARHLTLLCHSSYRATVNGRLLADPETAQNLYTSVSLAKPDPSAKREVLVASQYGVLYGRNAIIT